MHEALGRKTIYELPHYQKAILLVLVFIFCVLASMLLPAQPSDWSEIFYPISHNPLHPYDNGGFFNPPWAAVVLYPFHFFTVNTSRIINASLNIFVIGLLVVKRKGNILAVFLTITSYPFILLMANNQIEWIPALGFIFQNGWGLPFLLAKPQSSLLAALSWFLSVKNKTRFILPALIVCFGSFLVWGNWIGYLITNVRNTGSITWSVSPFPWAIPIGLGLIFYILKSRPHNSEILGALATYCLVPYFSLHSTTILFALSSVYYPRLTILFWFSLWIVYFLR